MRTLVAFVPVLHEGYRKFFTKYDGPKELYILGTTLTHTYKPLTKEIRQLEPVLMQKAVAALGIFERVEILEESNVQAFNAVSRDIILPDEDISRAVAEQYFGNAKITFDSIFLRWDKKNAEAEKVPQPDRRVTKDEFHREVMQRAETEALKSSDNWRHVGAALVKDGQIITVVHNHHLPSEHSPYVNGDPRSNWSRGVNMELATGFHAEASIIADAAKRGISLEGADLYVTVFPCPPCSKLIAYSGIKTLYCAGGNSILDAEEVMKSRGVEIVFVE
ncbi:MAG: deaminase [Patescibacteria group bacterium]